MTKELSITTIKKELMDAFLGDMRIVNSFCKHDDIKKITDYFNRNIFNHLTENDMYDCTDTYIYFDVKKSRKCYDVYIGLKAHISLLNDKDGVNLLDSISEYIEEIVGELYPYHKHYSNTPVCCKDNFGRRSIHFSLCENDMDAML